MGEIPYNLSESDWIGYPRFGTFAAGNVYLHQNNMNSSEYINKIKTDFYLTAKKEAMDFATKNNRKSCAVTNIRFQVLTTENSIQMFTDYFVVVW